MTASSIVVAEPGTRLAGEGRAGRLREAFRSRRLIAGTGIVGFFVLVAIIGPFFTSNPNQIGGPKYAAAVGALLAGHHPDRAGRARPACRQAPAPRSRSAWARRCSPTFVSIVIGIAGGYAGGIVDDILSLLSNVVLVIPTLPLVIVILAYVKSNGLLPLIIIIALTSWAASARVLRAQTLSVRNREYVLSARASGERLWRIVFVEIMPNELPIIVSNFIFGMIFAILTQAALAFIGLGDPTLLTWGNMLNIAYSDEALPIGAWWWIIPPGLCIALLGMGLALINFSLDELLNPRLRVYRPARARTPAASSASRA